jgi:hypothetical protein
VARLAGNPKGTAQKPHLTSQTRIRGDVDANVKNVNAHGKTKNAGKERTAKSATGNHEATTIATKTRDPENEDGSRGARVKAADEALV